MKIANAALNMAETTRPVGFQLKYLNEEAKRLGQFTRGSDDAAGYDIKACIEGSGGWNIYPGETLVVHTGVSLFINSPYVVGKVYVRSSVGSKRGLVLANGTGIIDSDYQGEWVLVLRNVSNVVQRIEHGERLAQVVFTPVFHPGGLIEVEEFLEVTNRGEGGFGSSGVK